MKTRNLGRASLVLEGRRMGEVVSYVRFAFGLSLDRRTLNDWLAITKRIGDTLRKLWIAVDRGTAP